MFNSVGLTFGLIIALFVPGCIFFLSMMANIYGPLSTNLANLKNVAPCLKDMSFFVLPLAVLAPLILGLILDSVRYVITWGIQWLAKSEIDTSLFGEDDRKYYDWVIENNFRFHQFYANFGLSLLVSAFVVRNIVSPGLLWAFFGFGAISCIAAVFAYKTTLKSLTNRAKSLKKEDAK